MSQVLVTMKSDREKARNYRVGYLIFTCLLGCIFVAAGILLTTMPAPMAFVNCFQETFAKAMEVWLKVAKKSILKSVVSFSTFILITFFNILPKLFSLIRNKLLPTRSTAIQAALFGFSSSLVMGIPDAAQDVLELLRVSVETAVSCFVLAYVLKKYKALTVFAFYATFHVFVRRNLSGISNIKVNIDPLIALLKQESFSLGKVLISPDFGASYCADLFGNGVIIIGSAMAEKASPLEMAAAIGHELGHRVHYDMQKKYLIGIVTILAMDAIFFFPILNNPLIFAAFGFEDKSLAAFYPSASIATWIIGPAIKPLLSLFNQSTEYAADDHTVKLGYGEHMLSIWLQ